MDRTLAWDIVQKVCASQREGRKIDRCTLALRLGKHKNFFYTSSAAKKTLAFLSSAGWLKDGRRKLGLLMARPAEDAEAYLIKWLRTGEKPAEENCKVSLPLATYPSEEGGICSPATAIPQPQKPKDVIIDLRNFTLTIKF